MINKKYYSINFYKKNDLINTNLTLNITVCVINLVFL